MDYEFYYLTGEGGDDYVKRTPKELDDEALAELKIAYEERMVLKKVKFIFIDCISSNNTTNLTKSTISRFQYQE